MGFKKQDVVAQSTVETEYIVAAGAANQVIWLKKLMGDLNLYSALPTILHIDNKSTISITRNPVMHEQTKHINIKFQEIRNAERSREIKLEYCSSRDQLADIMTKSLGNAKFEEMRSRLGIVNKILKEER